MKYDFNWPIKASTSLKIQCLCSLHIRGVHGSIWVRFVPISDSTWTLRVGKIGTCYWLWRNIGSNGLGLIRWWVGVGQSWVWVGGWDFAGFGWDLLILVERESLNFTGMEAKSMISNRNIKEEDKGTFIWMRKMERSFRRAGSIEFELSHLSLELTSSDLHIQVLPSTAMLIG